MNNPAPWRDLREQVEAGALLPGAAVCRYAELLALDVQDSQLQS